ncbi:MAG: hypothetical protein GY952_12435 [Rhodobacteraceae bacterium]|nr:hypothetical protein [Paracoccaceae bacterium]
MSDARNAILQNIRTANGALPPASEIEAAAAALIENPGDLRPSFSDQDNRSRFVEKATSERVTATVSEVAHLRDVPEAVKAYLAQASVPLQVALQPRGALTELNWDGIKTHSAPSPNEPAAVSIADLAVAETGSVVFLSAPDAPVLMNFLPLHHIVVVSAELIHRHLEDVFAIVGKAQQDQPRNLSIVTGTSGTADIEAKNIRGAHGPRFMHLIICQKVT